MKASRLYIAITNRVSRTAPEALFLIVMVCIGVVLSIGLAVVVPNRRADQLREQYARGMYDVCNGTLGASAQCLDAIRQGLASGWYEQPSPGFRWPLPTNGQSD